MPQVIDTFQTVVQAAIEDKVRLFIDLRCPNVEEFIATHCSDELDQLDELRDALKLAAKCR